MTDAPRDRTDGAQPEHDWDRLATEGPEAYEAFATYRDQGRDRSVRQAARSLGKNETTIGGWSSRHRWVARVAAYDRHLDARRRKEREDKILEMERQQVTQLAAARQALTAPIQSLLKRVADARGRQVEPFANVSDETLTRLATAAIRHLPAVVESERLVHGLSTENIGDGAPLSAEEARARAEGMDRGQLEEYLTGVDDGRAAEREAIAREAHADG